MQWKMKRISNANVKWKLDRLNNEYKQDEHKGKKEGQG